MSYQSGMFKSEPINKCPASSEWLVLSLTQPWASALFIPGLKRIETRGWKTQYRGPLYIHASKSFPRYAREFVEEQYIQGRLWTQFPFGAIIGRVDLIDIQRTELIRSKISLTEAEFGDFGDRRYAWMTENPCLLTEPVPAKGMLGLWTYKPEEVATHA